MSLNKFQIAQRISQELKDGYYVNLGIGISKRTVYSSDLTYNYIKINADYRS